MDEPVIIHNKNFHRFDLKTQYPRNWVLKNKTFIAFFGKNDFSRNASKNYLWALNNNEGRLRLSNRLQLFDL